MPTIASAAWGECDDVAVPLGSAAVECATIDVPLDYADPDGPTIPIALVRQPAGEPDARIGSVVFNPGGPGGSGVDFLATARLLVPHDVADVFDLVSFDPRGVGASASVDCEIIRDDGVTLIADDDRAAWDVALATWLDELATCSSIPPGLESFVGTNNAARDLDMIRAAVGDEQLTYVGYSYGTRLGAVYAELFPERVRALVLDGGVLPSTDTDEMSRQQAAGFDLALESFTAACDADLDCPVTELGPTLDVLVGLREEIAEVGSFEVGEPGRVLTPGELDLGVIAALYSRSTWTYLAQAIYVAELDADGSLFQVLADLYLGREPDGTYSNQVEAGAFINCADDEARPSEDEVWTAADDIADSSRYFGESLRASTGCLGLPDPVDPVRLGPAEGAAPILVIGTTGDPATPYDWSVQLAGSLASGVMYTVEGEGHTAYTSIDCVTPIVNAYLIDLVVPDDGEGCADDGADDPFPPPGESQAELVVAFFECLRENGADIDEVDLADILRDPSGEGLLGQLDLGDPDLLTALMACQSLLTG